MFLLCFCYQTQSSVLFCCPIIEISSLTQSLTRQCVTLFLHLVSNNSHFPLFTNAHIFTLSQRLLQTEQCKVFVWGQMKKLWKSRNLWLCGHRHNRMHGMTRMIIELSHQSECQSECYSGYSVFVCLLMQHRARIQLGFLSATPWSHKACGFKHCTTILRVRLD